jgi:hypothetical protein
MNRVAVKWRRTGVLAGWLAAVAASVAGKLNAGVAVSGTLQLIVVAASGVVTGSSCSGDETFNLEFVDASFLLSLTKITPLLMILRSPTAHFYTESLLTCWSVIGHLSS